jgi:hypothetical protein
VREGRDASSLGARDADRSGSSIGLFARAKTSPTAPTTTVALVIGLIVTAALAAT